MGKVKIKLPSEKYDIVLRKGVYYDVLRSFIKLKDIKKIKTWLFYFQKHFDAYIQNQLKAWSEGDGDKRCRDVNYILDVINEKIKGIKEYKFDLDLHKMNSTAEFILIKHPNLKCKRNSYVNMGNKYINIRKLLDNFCEDSNYIRNHIEDYKQKGICKDIISKITSNKDHLNQQLSDGIDHANKLFQISSDCTIDNINSMLESITCNSESADFSATARAGAEKDLENEEFGEEAGAEEIQQYLSESESSSNIKSTAIGLSLSGVVATGLLLYRTTPLGSWVNTNILNRSPISSLDIHASEDIVMDNFDPIHSSLNHDYDIPYHRVSNT
ncbi:PIR Superfamily Protein [Plasmodium ovale curtisi]|uniref:PIR Superfamily Protein n=1 Tax=Plasmodium ovale curtisi TaxID=864141 RepID=A0A1A8VMU2_PLAOA|nr:PIR Superfamily Protein [Plasmodium ovale curtisi]